MPKLRLIKDDPALQDIIPFPTGHGPMMGPTLGGRLGARFARPATQPLAETSGHPVDNTPTPSDLEHELLGTIDRMQSQLDELSDMIGPFQLYPEDDRPTAA